ncbi:MAG: hypothetical protein RI958_379 [Actinomycetota bacterium]
MNHPGTRRSARTPSVVGAHLVQAATSLVLHLLAAHRLGTTGLAEFATIASGLVVVGAVTVALVCDPLTMLTPATPEARAGLGCWALMIAVGAAVAGVVGGLAIVDGEDGDTELVALSVGAGAGLVAVTEVLRRAATLRGRLTTVTVVDLAGAGTAILFALRAAPTLRSLVEAVIVGRLVTLVLVTLVLLAPPTVLATHRHPRNAHRGRHPRARILQRADLSSVWRVGRWRLAQHTLRPAMWTVLRLLAIASAGPAAWGAVETARLAVAPAMVMTNGVGAALFVSMATDRSPTPDQRRRQARRAAATALVLQLAAVTLSLLALSVVAAFAGHATDVTRHDARARVEVDAVALAGWSALAAATAAALPAGVLASTGGAPAAPARNRATEVGATLAGAAILLALDGPPVIVPWLAAASTGVAGRRLWRAETQRTGATAPPPGATPGGAP